MSLSLPLMNNLCKRWTLPSHIQKDCDLYFLRSFSDQEFVQSLKISPDGLNLIIQEYGVNFVVIFQHGAEKVYERNGELAKRNEPNNTNYWCSFRSITFKWQGVDCTKSYVLVQVDKGVKDFRALKETRVPKALVAISAKEQAKESSYPVSLRSRSMYERKLFKSFAEASQPRDPEIPEIDEEV